MTASLATKSSQVRRACVIALGMSVLTFTGFVLLGVFDGDVASATAVGALASAVFADVGILTSYWAGRRARLLACAIWAVIAIALLAGTLLSLSSGLPDADLLLAYGTAILSFPSGLIAGPIAGQLFTHAGAFQTTVLWVIAIGAGCVQWFFVIPTLLRLRESHKDGFGSPKL